MRPLSNANPELPPAALKSLESKIKSMVIQTMKIAKTIVRIKSNPSEALASIMLPNVTDEPRRGAAPTLALAPGSANADVAGKGSGAKAGLPERSLDASSFYFAGATSCEVHRPTKPREQRRQLRTQPPRNLAVENLEHLFQGFFRSLIFDECSSQNKFCFAERLRSATGQQARWL